MINKILVIELGDNALRAAVVKREGKNAVILSAAEVYNSQPEDMDIVLEKLSFYPKQVILVSSDAKFLVSELPVPPGIKISSDKLQEAVRWEAQAYLNFPVTEGFFGYQLQRNNYKKSKTTPVLIGAISRDVYGQLSGICKRNHLILRGVFSKDSAFAFSSNRFLEGTKNRIILNINTEQKSISGTLINKGSPISFKTVSLDNAENLAAELSTQAGGTVEVVIAGSQKKHAEEFIGRFNESRKFSVRLWNVKDDVEGRQTEFSVKIGPQYAPAVGAALKGLGISGNPELVISDRVSLTKLLKTKIYMWPIVMVSIIALFFLAHFVFMKSLTTRYFSRIKNLKAEKERVQSNIIEFEQLNSQIRDVYKKRHYIEEILPARQKSLIDLLNTIARDIPFDVILNRIFQADNNTYLLEGSGLSAASITMFVKSLENLETAREAKLEAINEKVTGAEDADLFVYEFRIKVILK